MGADDADVGGRVVAQLADIASALQLPPPAAVAEVEPAPWPALLSALERLSVARAEPVAAASPTPTPPLAEPLADGLQAGLAPLLQLLGQSHQQQVRTGETLALLAGWVRQQMDAEPAPRQRLRPRRATTPEERALDEALMRHFYGESAVPPRDDTSVDDAHA